MPLVVALISGAVSQTVIRALIIRLAVAIGITAVSYTGISVGMTYIVGHIVSSYSGAPASALAFLALCKIPNAINIITSAFASALALKGLSAAGTLTSVKWSPGTAFTGS